jgi:hypothetical protein
VHALLGRIEIDEAVDLRRDEGISASVLHAYRFLDAGDARTRETDPHVRRRGLEIGRRG